jgi:hypothetical protein
LEKARLAAENDITSLELRKQQMEVLVRKATLSLFLQEQHNLYKNKVVEAINQNNELSNNLKRLSDTDAKLRALDEEIQKDENVDLLLEIINEAKRQSTEGYVIELGSPLLDAVAKVAATAANVMRATLLK